MTTGQVSRQRRVARVPGITGIRLTPTGGDGTLVNLSASGVLVECESRVAPRTPITVRFIGTFSPASADGRVVRCLVAGIGKDGTIRYQIGIAFTELIPFNAADASPLPVSAASPSALPQEPPPSIEIAAETIPPPSRPVTVRNRW